MFNILSIGFWFVTFVQAPVDFVEMQSKFSNSWSLEICYITQWQRSCITKHFYVLPLSPIFVIQLNYSFPNIQGQVLWIQIPNHYSSFQMMLKQFVVSYSHPSYQERHIVILTFNILNAFSFLLENWRMILFDHIILWVQIQLLISFCLRSKMEFLKP